MSDNRDFNDKVVLITGSSSGIGAATAEEFARAGAQVVITGRNVEKLGEVAEKCFKASLKGLKPLKVVADITNEEDCQRIIDSTIQNFGRLDILVNSAGMPTHSSVEDPSILKTFDLSMKTNLRSIIHLTHLSVKHLEKTKGNIVNVSSILSIKPHAKAGISCVIKSALDMFTKCAALELGAKGIRVNAVNPALVRTNFGLAMGLTQASYDAWLSKRDKDYPLGRVGQPIDIANAILFLASDKCAWITGTNFLADGGRLLNM